LPIDELVALLAVLSAKQFELHGELTRRPAIDYPLAFRADPESNWFPIIRQLVRELCG
jgi:hypothetical protein